MNKIFCVLPVLFSVMHGVSAQTLDTSVLQQQSKEQREREQLLQEELKDGIRLDAEVIYESTVNEPIVEEVGALFTLKSIRFSQSKILDKQVLADLSQAILGREIGLGDLQKLTESINEVYRQQGIFTAQAILPPQKVNDGVIFIRLVEGVIGSVNIDGNKSTNTEWIKTRLPDLTGELVNVNRLQDSLHQFNRLYDIQARVELAQGRTFGTTDLNFQIIEPKQHSGQIYFDNYASKTVGPERVGVQYNNASLFGARDAFSAGLSKSDGNFSAVVYYGVPINTKGGRLSYTGIGDETDFTSSAVSGQRIEGTSGNHSFTWEQPWYANQVWKISTSASLEFRESHSFIDTIEFVDKRIKSFPLNINFSQLSPTGSWYASLGHVRFNTQEEHGNLDDWQSKWTANFARFQVLDEAWSFLLNTAVQYSDEKFLDSSEQFNIGSVGSVRGYDLGAKSGAAGYLINLELQQKALKLNGKNTQITSIYFLDNGGSFNHSPDTRLVRGKGIISSLGWGLKVTHKKHWNMSLIFAQALNAKKVEQKNTVHAHFRLSYLY